MLWPQRWVHGMSITQGPQEPGHMLLAYWSSLQKVPDPSCNAGFVPTVSVSWTGELMWVTWGHAFVTGQDKQADKRRATHVLIPSGSQEHPYPHRNSRRHWTWWGGWHSGVTSFLPILSWSVLASSLPVFLPRLPGRWWIVTKCPCPPLLPLPHLYQPWDISVRTISSSQKLLQLQRAVTLSFYCTFERLLINKKL